MKFGLPQETINKINSVFANHPQIEEVIIYGSRATGSFLKSSDIDITLKGSNITDELLSKIYWEIDDLDVLYLVDISIFDKLNVPALEEHINKVGQVFYSKSSAQQ